MSVSARSICLGMLLGGASVLSLAAPVQAQQNSLFGGSGPTSGQSGFGSATTGASFGVGSSAGGLTSSSFPGGQVAGGGTNTGGLGMGLGTPGGMTQPGQQRTGIVGQQNTRFVGMAQAAQNQPGSNPNQFNRQGQNRNAGARRAGQNANQANNQGGSAASNPAQGRSIRPQLRVGFAAPRATVTGTAGKVAVRFDKLASRSGFEGVAVETEGNTLILRGQVDSADVKRLATTLARLEPGVRSVRNELTVKAPAPAAQ